MYKGATTLRHSTVIVGSSASLGPEAAFAIFDASRIIDIAW